MKIYVYTNILLYFITLYIKLFLFMCLNRHIYIKINYPLVILICIIKMNDIALLKYLYNNSLKKIKIIWNNYNILY